MAVINIPDVDLQKATLAFLEGGPKKLFINNEWVNAKSGETFASLNPATGEILAELSLAGEDDVDVAVEAAHAAIIQRFQFG